MDTPNFRHASLICVQVIAVGVGTGCIRFSLLAFYNDKKWNLKIEKSKLKNGTLFEQRTVDNLVRKSLEEDIFIAVVICLFAFSFVHVFIYAFCYIKSFIWTLFNVILNGLAAVALMTSSCFYMKSAIRINMKYEELYKADGHHFTDYFFCSVKNYREYVQLTDEQKFLLDSEAVCQKWEAKYAATALALINSILYLILAWLEYLLHSQFMSHAKKSREINIPGTPGDKLNSKEELAEYFAEL